MRSGFFEIEMNLCSAYKRFGSNTIFIAGVFQGDHYRGGQHQHGFNAVNRHPRKQAVSVYCESCDKDFKNQDKLNEHLEKHIKVQEWQSHDLKYQSMKCNFSVSEM